MAFSKKDIQIDPGRETERLVGEMRRVVGAKLRKRGAVVGISGGIDSSVCLALSVRAFGPERVLGLTMPESDSNPESALLARKLARTFGVAYLVEDMTAALAGFNTYRRRDEAIKNVFPEYDATYRAKIVLPSALGEKDQLNVFRLTIISPEGEEKTERLPLAEYLQIVAASNFKQRSRMSMLYYHADRLNYAVIGTGNKNEHEQGFFVKYGDGGADIKPIAHLFKTQVYQLAAFLGVPEEIRRRTPTTDTYSAECTQEEFFFRVPFEVGDVVWYAMEKGVPVGEVARELGIGEEQVAHIQNDIRRKIRATDYLRAEPQHLG
ncbi:MAG TPA: NAD(+) synthase [Candidatus Aminicenantes bacterium]|nr:NAD(+) synthase [Candidatus Aminicenantes bacterium]HRY64895.1 NAD(+) synthase [Candidatus Aminicenantes bacterium]HRZ71808.1 NAD(+) synthase [Candidatus Aminicenantes bacterium]